MSRPDWNSPDCPSWARYLVQDMSGDWFWHENKPKAWNRGWLARPYFDLASLGKGPVTNWRDSLEERPTEAGQRDETSEIAMGGEE